MSEAKDYPLDFVKRTIELINKIEPVAKKEKLEVTFLLNCMLGMIVSVHENTLNTKQHEIFKTKLNSTELEGIVPETIKILDTKGRDLSQEDKKKINEFKFLKNFKEAEIPLNPKPIKFKTTKQVFELDLGYVLRKVRNGISHQNIMPTNQYGKWQGIRIWNEFEGVKNFAIEFKHSELKIFSLKVAELYVASKEKKL
jgi:hypothetical protein